MDTNELISYIEREIRIGNIHVGQQMLSVSEACATYHVSRDTILTAYRILIRRGIIKSIPGKGYYITSRNSVSTVRVYVLFDAMNQYKETLYRSLLQHLGNGYSITIAFHYYDTELFDTLVSNAIGKYDYYVLMPHFKEDVNHTIQKIASEKLLLLDAMPKNYKGESAAVYQHFKSDAYEGFKVLLPKLKNYKALHIVYNDKFQYMPQGYVEGAKLFSEEFHYPIYVEPSFDMKNIEHGHCYMAVSERDLASIVKSIMQCNFRLGRDLGLLSLDDTPLKEVLVGGITTLSTDFELMGKTAAELIRKNERKQIPNPWKLEDRGSL